MIRLFSLFSTLCLLFSSANAAWFSDENDKLCYDWHGNRESCSRDSTRRESLIAGQFNSYYGNEAGSMTGSFGQGVLLTTVKSKRALRFLFGGQFIYSAANSYINNGSAIPTTMMSVDLVFGASIKPFHDTYLKPIIELSAIAGFKSIEFANPPTGIENKNLKPSYGAKLSLGLDIPLSRFYALRPAIDYQITRVPGIIDNQDFVLDAIGLSLGVVFL